MVSQTTLKSKHLSLGILAILVVVWILKDAPVIDADTWEYIKNERVNSTSEVKNRQFQYLIIFQQAGLIMAIMLIPVALTIYKNQSILQKHRKLWKRSFRQSPETSKRSFDNKLMINYPDLTTYDIVLCELLVDKLSSKEIAIKLNISAASVNTARYRLRKKLGLTPNVDLVKFLNSFL